MGKLSPAGSVSLKFGLKKNAFLVFPPAGSGSSKVDFKIISHIKPLEMPKKHVYITCNRSSCPGREILGVYPKHKQPLFVFPKKIASTEHQTRAFVSSDRERPLDREPDVVPWPGIARARGAHGARGGGCGGRGGHMGGWTLPAATQRGAPSPPTGILTLGDHPLIAAVQDKPIHNKKIAYKRCPYFCPRVASKWGLL